jgi:hypothetical protein
MNQGLFMAIFVQIFLNQIFARNIWWDWLPTAGQSYDLSLLSWSVCQLCEAVVLKFQCPLNIEHKKNFPYFKVKCVEHTSTQGILCKTPDFHRKPESLYHRNSPWISGYRVQNVSQIKTESHTSHHIRALVHNLLHVHYGVHQYKPLGWIRVKFYATVASFPEGSSSFILLATGILERSGAPPQSYHPSALLSYSDSYPTHPKSIPKEWDRSTSPTVCSFKWPNF